MELRNNPLQFKKAVVERLDVAGGGNMKRTARGVQKVEGDIHFLGSSLGVDTSLDGVAFEAGAAGSAAVALELEAFALLRRSQHMVPTWGRWGGALRKSGAGRDLTTPLERLGRALLGRAHVPQ